MEYFNVALGLVLSLLVSVGHALQSASSYPCALGQPLYGTPVCDLKLTPRDRAFEFVKLLNVEQKAAQFGNNAPAIPEFNIVAYEWWTEALHGVNSHCSPDGSCSTSYPCALNLAATFNMSVVYTMGKQISDEGRALFNEGTVYGLDFWAPNINIVRDPRWGRGQETPGEDPYLTGLYAIHYIAAMQNDTKSSYYYKTVATPKHFAAYNLDTWRDDDRLRFDAKVSAQDLWQTYLPAFEMAIVEGGARSIMCSYNEVNGIPSCANRFLLDDILRKRWGFQGYVVSDCDAVSNVFDPHEYNSSLEAASIESLQAGTDLDCGDSYQRTFMGAILGGRLDIETVDLSLARLFEHRILLGTFDDPATIPSNNVTDAAIDSAQHRAHARDSAAQSIVLLKNEKVGSDPRPILPLDPAELSKVLITGPLADDSEALCSNYHGDLPKTVSVKEGLQNALKGLNVSVEFQQGCGLNVNHWDYFHDAISAASRADLAVVVLGLGPSEENEGHDRANTRFPGVQLELLKGIVNVQPRTILIVVAGSSVDISFAKEHVAGILYGFYPGEEGGNAIADVMLGLVNPSGRLPLTLYHDEDVSGDGGMDMTSMDMRAGKGRTYRFFTGQPVYHFGHGLSYTAFQYARATNADENFLGDVSVSINVKVTNVGDRSGATSVLGMVQTSTSACPRLQLFDFKKVFLVPGESTIVKLTLKPKGTLCLQPGKPELGIATDSFLPDVDFRILVNGEEFHSFRAPLVLKLAK